MDTPKKKYAKPAVKLMPLKLNQYYGTEQTKNNIFLHHTAGDSAKGAIDWWNQTPEHVGTPFVIDRDGTIFQCYDEKYWAYSLGVKAVGGKSAYNTERHGIPIEIVSLGWLKKVDEKYYSYPLWPSTLKKIEVAKDNVLALDFLGEKYWHKYTDKQIESLKNLMLWLVETYNIKVQPKLEDFYKYDVSVALDNKPGIWSHTTVRKDKTDIFPQKELLDMLVTNFSVPKKA